MEAATERPIDPMTPERIGDGESETSKWKGKGKEVISPSDYAPAVPDVLDDVPEDDWIKYEPPAALLSTTLEMDSDVINQILSESIARIKERIAEDEERRRVEAEAVRAREEEQARVESEKGKQPETASASKADNIANEPVRPPSPNRNPYAYAMSKKTLRADPNGLLAPETNPKPKKRSLFTMLKRLNQDSDNGETSAAGASRSKQADPPSNEDAAGRKRSALRVLRKAAGSSTSPKPPSENDTMVECVSCLDDFPAGQTIPTPCRHHYCRDCFQRLMAAACENEAQWPPKCCLTPLPPSTVLLGLASSSRRRGKDKDKEAARRQLLRTWRDRRAEWSVPVADRVYCSAAACSLWCRPDHVDPARRAARCPQGHWTCTLCRGPQHDAGACPQDRDLLRTRELAAEEGWQQCHGCGAYVEHREACQHMTCRCGAEFCYVCGAVWRTCRCTMEQLAAAKQSAGARRAARVAEDAAEEVELREALRQVAAFEREEARQAARRAQAAAERREREREARRTAIVACFAALRDTMVEVRAAQRATVQTDHEALEQGLAAQAAVAEAALRDRQAAEGEARTAAVEAQVREREDALARECAARVAEERRIEEAYAAQLRAHGDRRRERRERKRQRRREKGKKVSRSNNNNNVNDDASEEEREAKEEAEEEAATQKMARAALAELQRRMDCGFLAWRKRAEAELEACRWAGREELAIGVELAAEVMRRLAKAQHADRGALVRRRAAEWRWVEAAVVEGERLLAEREGAEMEAVEVDVTVEDVVGENGEELEDMHAWLGEGGKHINAWLGDGAEDINVWLEEGGEDDILGDDSVDNNEDDADDGEEDWWTAGMAWSDAEDQADYYQDLRQFVVPGAFVTAE